MVLNAEGWMLLCLFVYLIVMLLIGFPLYGRREEALYGGKMGAWFTALGMLGGEQGLFFLMVLPALVLLGGAQRGLLGVSVLLGGTLVLLLGTRYSEVFLRYRSNCLHRLLGKATSSRAVELLSLYCMVFFGTLFVSGCIGAMGKLFSMAFSLAYEIAVPAAAALVLLYSMFSGVSMRQRLGFLTALLTAAGLAFTAFFTYNAGGEAAPLLAQTLPFNGLTAVSDLTWGLGCLAMPLLIARPLKTRKKTTGRWAAVVFAPLGLLCLAGAVLLPMTPYAATLELTTQAQAETLYIFSAIDNFPPIAAGLLLTAFLAAALTAASGVTHMLAASVTRDCVAVTFMELNEKALGLIKFGISLLIVGLALLPAMEQTISTYELWSLAWAGCGGAFLPIVLVLLGGGRVKWTHALAAMIAGGLASLLWSLTPVLATNFFGLLPGAMLGFAVALPGIRPSRPLTVQERVLGVSVENAELAPEREEPAVRELPVKDRPLPKIDSLVDEPDEDPALNEQPLPEIAEAPLAEEAVANDVYAVFSEHLPDADDPQPEEDPAQSLARLRNEAYLNGNSIFEEADPDEDASDEDDDIIRGIGEESSAPGKEADEGR